MSRYANNNKLACLLQCNYNLNKKALCLKRSWDEVAEILDKACSNKRKCSNKKCR